MDPSTSLQLETFVDKMREIIKQLRKLHDSHDSNGLFQLIVDTIDTLIIIKTIAETYSPQIYNYICKAGYFAEMYGVFLDMAKNAAGYFTSKSGESRMKSRIDNVMTVIDKKKQNIDALTEQMKSIFKPLVELKEKLESQGQDAKKDLSLLDLTAQFDLCILKLYLNIKTCQEELTKLDKEIDTFLAKKLGWAIGGTIGGTIGGVSGGAAATMTTGVLVSNPIGWIIAGATVAVTGLGFGIAGIVNSVQHSKNKSVLKASKVKISSLKAYFTELNDNLKKSVKILQAMGIDVSVYPEEY